MKGGRPPLPRMLAAVGVVLLGLSAISSYVVFLWRIEEFYTLEIRTPANFQWTLWVPAPDRPVAVTTQGSVTIRGTVGTAYGLRWNLTGDGDARIQAVASSFVFSPALEPLGLQPPMTLSGHEGQPLPGGYRIWRATLDPSANLTVYAVGVWSATRVGDDWRCAGPNYNGPVEEGWTFVRQGIGDCFGAIGWPIGVVIPTLFAAAGGVLFATGRRRRGWSGQ